ncbi:MAG TPA: TadE family protein [Chloroflexota bacterium]|nr:TadE family protein [Chloroflexota bacterium]
MRSEETVHGSRRVPKHSVLRGGSKGQGVVEFALVFPIFIMLLFGLFNGAWLFFQQESINNAARSAAREAAILNPLFEAGGAGGCSSTYGEPSVAQASPAMPIERAAQQGSALVPINTSILCAAGGTSATMTSSTSQAGTATVTVTASPILDSANTVSATVTFTAHPLAPFWPQAALTLSATSTEARQGA